MNKMVDRDSKGLTQSAHVCFAIGGVVAIGCTFGPVFNPLRRMFTSPAATALPIMLLTRCARTLAAPIPAVMLTVTSACHDNNAAGV